MTTETKSLYQSQQVSSITADPAHLSDYCLGVFEVMQCQGGTSAVSGTSSTEFEYSTTSEPRSGSDRVDPSVIVKKRKSTIPQRLRGLGRRPGRYPVLRCDWSESAASCQTASV